MTAIDGMCRASDLRYLVNAKQFTMFPSHLLRYLQMDAGIGLDEFGMWVAIYDLVSADPELQRSISWKFLANRFGFSEKTAKRICTRLVDKKLLVIESRHREDGSQLPSLFKIRVSTKVAHRLLLETPDRAKPIRESGDNQERPELKPGQDASPQDASPQEREIPQQKNGAIKPELKPDARGEKRVNVRELMRKISADMKKEEASEPRVDVNSSTVSASGDHGDVSVPAVDGARDCGDVTAQTVDEGSPSGDVNQECGDGKWEYVDGSLQYVDGVQSPVNANPPHVKMSQREANSVNGQILLAGASMQNCALAARLEGVRKRSVFAQETKSQSGSPDVAGRSENVSERKIEAGQKSTKKGEVKAVRGEGARNDHQEQNPSFVKTNKNSLTKMIARKLTEIGLQFERVVALTCEVQASIECGSLKKFSLNHALNIAAKLIRTGRWTAPRLAYR